MSPALLALTDPAKVPDAASQRLADTAALLAAARHRYASLLVRMASVTQRASALLPLAVSGSSTDADLAALANCARVFRAVSALLSELAHRLDGLEQIETMRLATLLRHADADVRLVQREYVPLVYQGLDAEQAGLRESVRILPGAEAALAALDRDPILEGATWDLDQLAAALAKWVSA